MVYYHGTSDALGIDYMLIPPCVSGNLQEADRKRNLDQVFFTADYKSAQIYAGRACNRFGGKAVIYRVIPMGEVTALNTNPGTSVYYAKWAFVEQI